MMLCDNHHTAAAAVLAVALAGAALTGCDRDHPAAPPAPATLTDAAIGYYCNMIVEHHLGPKGQVHLPGKDEPLWFASVRDTLAFTMLPEEPKNILAIYVTDVGRAQWDHPESDTWTDARTAWYVVGSDRTGGMGATETVPFAQRDAAEQFASVHGGEVMGFDAVPRSAVLSHGDAHAAMPMQSTVHPVLDELNDHARLGQR